MLATILAKIGLPILIEAVGEGLKQIDNPVARGAAKALDDVDEAIRHGQISEAQAAEANRHIEALAKLRSEDMQTGLRQVNESLRAEIVSNDPYVRRMRPTFGYLMALTWAAQMFGLAYVIVFETERAGIVLEAMESLGMIWTVGLSVLGIYVYKRSQDKKLLGRFGLEK